MEFHASLVTLVHHPGQRVPIGRRGQALLPREVAAPRLQGALVEGVAFGSHLKHDGVDAATLQLVELGGEDALHAVPAEPLPLAVLAHNSANARSQFIIYTTDQAYWQVVSLKHKKALAESYLELLKKLDSDVQKMISEGVATRSEGLSVSVKVNEAEMTVQKVNDGLTLSKMLLCQQIGLPTNEKIVLADEDSDDLKAITYTPDVNVAQALELRPELKMLETAVDMSRQTTNILKAANLPQVALTGGYAVSNPNVFNGFEKKFGGFWNVGLLVRVPLWNWGDVTYKVRASKGATAIANLELEEAREKVELQVNQSAFHAEEANKRLAMAQSNIERADENLRTANIGFSEGVISPTTVMEAQTAWLQAQSQKIDAQIDVLLTAVNLQKALGRLNIEN